MLPSRTTTFDLWYVFMYLCDKDANNIIVIASVQQRAITHVILNTNTSYNIIFSSTSQHDNIARYIISSRISFRYTFPGAFEHTHIHTFQLALLRRIFRRQFYVFRK